MNELIAALWRDETPYVLGAALLLVAILYRFLATGRVTLKHSLLFFVFWLLLDAVAAFFAARHEARIRHHEGMKQALLSFDEETGGRWHEAVDYCVTYQQEYEILRLKSDVKALNQPPYRALYKQLPLKRRIRMHLVHAGIIQQ